MEYKLVFIFVFICIINCICPAALGEYVLRPGDVIQIKVVDHDEFTQKAKIRPDGKINYPVIGEINVSGLTSAQLVKIMEEKLAPYINNVVVSVSIESYFSNKIFIIGDVYRSGEHKIFEPIDVVKALALAGGLKNSKTNMLRIVRADGDVINVELQKFFKKKSAAELENYTLYPGDTLYVPERFKIPWSALAVIVGIANILLQMYVIIGI
jgi:polysaccharide export outer membrane protein